MAERAILEAEGKTKGEGEEMKPPRTAERWALLEKLGWRHDPLPVSIIMASHEAMENELAGLKAGFDAEGRTDADACCEEFKRDQAERIRELEKELAATKEQWRMSSICRELQAELDAAKQELEQARQDAIRALGERNDARNELASERALADMLKETLEHVHDWHYAKPAYDAWVAARTK